MQLVTALIVISALFLVGLLLRRFTKYKKTGRVLLLLGGIPLFLCALTVSVLYFLLNGASGVPLTRPQLDLLMLVIPSALLLCCLHSRHARKKAVLIPLCALLLFGAALNIQSRCIRSVPVVKSAQQIEYSPYSAKYAPNMPDETCELQLSGDLPRLDGATALYPVYASFYRAVYPQNAEWNRLIRCSTTSGAYRSIIDGTADIIFTAEPSAAQLEEAAKNGTTLEFTPLGLEAFVFIVNSRNPLDDITPERIRDIYTGRITNWTELGVQGLGEILPYQRSEGSGSQTAFEHWFAGEELLPARTELVSDSMSGLYETVADYRNFRNAIGYSFRYYCMEMLGGGDIRLLSVNGIAPTTDNIEDGTYPFTDRFYAVTRSDAGENIRSFVRWMTGPQGQEVIRKAGYTPVTF